MRYSTFTVLFFIATKKGMIWKKNFFFENTSCTMFMKYLSYVYSILFLIRFFSKFLLFFFFFWKSYKKWHVRIVLSLVEAFDKQGTGVYASGAAGQCCRMDHGEDKEILSLPWSFPPPLASTIFLLSSLSGPTIIALMHVWLNRAASLQRQCAAAEYQHPKRPTRNHDFCFFELPK